MALRIHKGTSSGWDLEALKASEDALGSWLVSVIHTWRTLVEQEKITPLIENEEEFCRVFGKINYALSALENDLHNLSILVDMINYIYLAPANPDVKEKRWLYITNLVESYFANLRSIFDFTSIIVRVTLNERSLRSLPSKNQDSFNALLSFVKKETTKGIIPDQIVSVIVKHENTFEVVKLIRDQIIHKGKEPSIMVDSDDKLYFVLHQVKNGQLLNMAPDILGVGQTNFLLFDYLAEISRRTIDYLEDLGDAIFSCLNNGQEQELSVWLCALQGLCMPEFIKFIGNLNT